MAYVPQNLTIFTAAFAGAMAGMITAQKVPTSTTQTRYDDASTAAGAWAEEFDTLWVGGSTEYAIATIQEMSEAAWDGRTPPNTAQFATPASYSAQIGALIAALNAGQAFMNGQGIPPLQTGGIPSVATLAALSAINDSQQPDNAWFLVATQKSIWRLDKQSTLSTVTNDGNVLATLSGIGRWLRVALPETKWASQISWFVDAVAGNDENSGAAGLPLKTFAELGHRLIMANYESKEVTFAGNIPATDTFRPVTSYSSTPSGSGVVFASLIIRGNRTVQASGVVTAAVATVPATNTPTNLTDSTTPIAWGAHIGRMVVITNGAFVGATAHVVKDLGANTARLTDFGIFTVGPAPTFTIVNTILTDGNVAALAGATFDIVTMAQFAATFNTAGLPPGITVSFSDIEISGGGAQQTWLGNYPINYRSSKFVTIGALLNQNLRLSTFGTLFGPAVLTRMAAFQGQRNTFRATGFLNINFQNLYGAHQTFDTCILQASDYQNGRSTGTEPTMMGAGSVIGTKGLGIYDAPIAGALATGNGLVVQRASDFVVNAGSALHGSGNPLFGVIVRDGGTLMIQAGITPTLTGTSGDLQVEASATAIPPLVAGAAVPALSALVTWGNWTAAPFSRFVTNYATGSRVISVV